MFFDEKKTVYCAGKAGLHRNENHGNYLRTAFMCTNVSEYLTFELIKIVNSIFSTVSTPILFEYFRSVYDAETILQ